jgi:enamine deaminase RidA (YjgF/YER057c/UK114 family)
MIKKNTSATKRLHISTGTPWEPIVGYSRAVRVDDVVHVSGTTATDTAGNVVGRGNPYQQTVQALRNIAAALESVGARMEDVVRTRVYVLRIAEWEQIGRAHGEVFSKIRPATTMVQVSRLIDPEILVEIEAEAIVTPQEDSREPAASRRPSEPKALPQQSSPRSSARSSPRKSPPQKPSPAKRSAGKAAAKPNRRRR